MVLGSCTYTPKLGGFGKIVESYFSGTSIESWSQVRGTWEDDEKWGFELRQCGRNSQTSAIKREGTVFCSDGWKAYNKLVEHQIYDKSVNHSEIYVGPETLMLEAFSGIAIASNETFICLCI